MLAEATAGAGFVLQQPLAWLAIAAVLLATRGLRPKLASAAFGLWLLAAAAGGRLAPDPAHAAAVAGFLLAAGALVAAGWPGTGPFALLAAAAGGAGFALAAGLPLATAAESVGALTAGGAALVLGSTALRGVLRSVRSTPWQALAPRVLGAWIAAVGGLLLALHLSGRAL